MFVVELCPKQKPLFTLGSHCQDFSPLFLVILLKCCESSKNWACRVISSSKHQEPPPIPPIPPPAPVRLSPPRTVPAVRTSLFPAGASCLNSPHLRVLSMKHSTPGPPQAFCNWTVNQRAHVTETKINHDENKWLLDTLENRYDLHEKCFSKQRFSRDYASTYPYLFGFAHCLQDGKI